jgi:hypothetical protein
MLVVPLSSPTVKPLSWILLSGDESSLKTGALFVDVLVSSSVVVAAFPLTVPVASTSWLAVTEDTVTGKSALAEVTEAPVNDPSDPPEKLNVIVKLSGHEVASANWSESDKVVVVAFTAEKSTGSMVPPPA